MKCHVCGGEMRVYKVRRRKKDGVIYRRRRCLVCGVRVTTYEAAKKEEGDDGQLHSR